MGGWCAENTVQNAEVESKLNKLSVLADGTVIQQILQY